MTKLTTAQISKVVHGFGPNADFNLVITLTTDRNESIEFTLTREEVIDHALALIVNADAKDEFILQLNNLEKLKTGIASRSDAG